MCAIEAGDFRKFVIRDSVPTKNAFERAGEGEFDDRAAICHEYSGGRELLNDSIVTGLIISRHLITIFEFYYKISPVSGERPRYARFCQNSELATRLGRPKYRLITIFRQPTRSLEPTIFRRRVLAGGTLGRAYHGWG